MKIFNRIKELFIPVEVEEKPPVTVKDLQIMSDIWIKEDGEIYSGWVWDISRRCITVIYGEDSRDFRFQIPRPLTCTQIEQDGKVLYCNNPKDDN